MRSKALAGWVLLFLAATAWPAGASELRCGWLENPTPGNWWLTDRDASWTIRVQGGNFEPGGIDLPDISVREYVRTNGSYGYACACMRVDVDRRRERIVTIHTFRQLPLAQCRSDDSLPSME